MTSHQGNHLATVNDYFADSAECYFSCRSADLIVEVAHPLISAEYGAEFLKAADFMVQISSVNPVRIKHLPAI